MPLFRRRDEGATAGATALVAPAPLPALTAEQAVFIETEGRRRGWRPNELWSYLASLRSCIAGERGPFTPEDIKQAIRRLVVPTRVRSERELATQPPGPVIMPVAELERRARRAGLENRIVESERRASELERELTLAARERALADAELDLEPTLSEEKAQREVTRLRETTEDARAALRALDEREAQERAAQSSPEPAA